MANRNKFNQGTLYWKTQRRKHFEIKAKGKADLVPKEEEKRKILIEDFLKKPRNLTKTL